MPQPSCFIPLPHVYERLLGVSSSLGRQYAKIASDLQTRLTADEWPIWADYCDQLAQSGWRAWESAEAFCRVTPFLLRHMDATALWFWADQGKIFARHSADVATAFFRSARRVAPHRSHEEARLWAANGYWFLQTHPAQPSLAVSYFQLSPHLYERYPLSTVDLWLQLGQQFAQAGVQTARTFFDLSRTLMSQEPLTDLTAPWTWTHDIVSASPDLALQALERYPALLYRLGADLTARVHEILLGMLAADVTQASIFLRVVGGTLGLLAAAERRQTLVWCQHIAAVHPEAALEFLQHVPDLSRRLPGERLQGWITTGLEVASQNDQAGMAYFSLESVTAHHHLHRLQGQVSFAEAQRVLQLYTEGFSGRKMELRTIEALPTSVEQGEPALPTSDGRVLFVPAQVETFPEARDNFAVYKVAILHQLGFYEYETFSFRIDECQRRLRQTLPAFSLHAAAAAVVDGTYEPEFARFFAAFEQPQLARQLFSILEDARIDAALARRYKGLRQDLTRLMQHSLEQRPLVWELPLRQALVEGLLQFTLGASLSPLLARGLHVLLQRLMQQAEGVLAETATVYDTAAAVIACYHLITQIPEHALVDLSPDMAAQLEALADELPDDADMIALADLFKQAGEGADEMPAMPDSSEPAEGLEPVPYRGEMKPELVQKKMKLDELAEELDQLQDALSPLTAEQLKELLESGDIEIKSLQEGDLSATSGLFLSDLEGREAQALKDALARLESLQEEVATLDAELEDAWGDLTTPQDQAVFYDEWDHLIQDYRHEWCRLTETVLDEDDTEFVRQTRQKYADMIARVRRQFQLLKPEMFRKIKRLIDGEEIDLDSVIEAIVDRRAGNPMSDKVYMRRDKRDREVAAVFLLDMSASTDDEVPETPPTGESEAQPVPERRQYDFSGFVMEDYYSPRPSKTRQESTRRRIIDVEKEALVMMAEALETLGDAYAVYGFSGYGRDQVDFFIAKEFSDVYDARTQARIAAIKPHRSTRMGPAIRHAVSKLERQDARIKTLLMLSDGYPQDFDYGKDRKSKDYGIQDTMMALREAQLKGIQTFCITVDPSGHDYLREMCPDQQYLVIDDIRALPDELPKVYRGLTT